MLIILAIQMFTQMSMSETKMIKKEVNIFFLSYELSKAKYNEGRDLELSAESVLI